MIRLRCACLVMFYATYGYMVYRAARFPWTGQHIWQWLDLLIFVSNFVLLMEACLIDAKVRRHPLSDGTTLIAGITLPVSMAVYLIWSRGWRGVLWLVFHVFLLTVVAILSTSTANAVTMWQFAAVRFLHEDAMNNAG